MGATAMAAPAPTWRRGPMAAGGQAAQPETLMCSISIDIGSSALATRPGRPGLVIHTAHGHHGHQLWCWGVFS